MFFKIKTAQQTVIVFQPKNIEKISTYKISALFVKNMISHYLTAFQTNKIFIIFETVTVTVNCHSPLIPIVSQTIVFAAIYGLRAYGVVTFKQNSFQFAISPTKSLNGPHFSAIRRAISTQIACHNFQIFSARINSVDFSECFLLCSKLQIV